MVKPENKRHWIRHVAGGTLLALAFSLLLAIPLLPSRGASGLELPFLKDESPPIMMAFAGYPGCAETCPVSLNLMANAWQAIGSPEAVGLQFINIDPHTADSDTRAFAQAFHPSFRSFSVTLDNAEQLRKKLAVRSLNDTAAGHNGLIFLFRRDGRSEWRIERLYSTIPTQEKLTADLWQLAQPKQGDTDNA